MPGREIPLVSGEFYHVLNRGTAAQPIFFNKRDYQHALETLFYNQNILLPTKFSKFLTFSITKKEELLTNLKNRKKIWCEINSFCLMPNHFHLLLQQKEKNGISKFIGNFTNSYTKYFNTKRERAGSIFQGKFKAIRIETDEQLLHVSRYIHLNPFSSFVVKSLKDLEKYPYSSLKEYLGNNKSSFCGKKIILEQFDNNLELYKKFVFDQADYQRSLEVVKHLSLED